MKLGSVIPFITGSVFAASDSHPATKPSHQHNANHIFNAIQSSMRQWGSSLNHNGMSIFLATVPQDVELYHGTSNPTPVNGTQWLAFEPEHALVFARERGPPGGGKGKPGEPPRWETDQNTHGSGGSRNFDRLPIPPHFYGKEENPDYREHHQWSPPPPPPHHFGHEEDDRRNEWEPEHTGAAENARQKPISASQRPTLDRKPSGYLHTYRTKHPLRLLYVDGQSAAKSTKGTLDMQDLVLLHENPPEEAVKATQRSRKMKDDEGDGFDRVYHDEPHPFDLEAPNEFHVEQSAVAQRTKDPRRPHGGPLGDSVRAERLCDLARTEYKGCIDGILRMEAGFEIILCGFAQHLDVVSIAAANPGMDGPGPGAGGDDMLSYYQAVASRYDGIGGRRVVLDYGNFLTLFAVEEALYFDETGRPRVKNETRLIAPFRRKIRELALSDRSADEGVDWQAISDMIAARYADRIAYLASGEIKDVEHFRAEASRAIRPHIDYSNRNTSQEIQHCSNYALPSTRPSDPAKGGLAYDSIYTVNSVICRTLTEASTIDTLAHGLAMMRGLRSWLGWTGWKRCSGCGPHEICFLPIWPAGDAKDFEHPSCRSDFSGPPGNYWGGFGKPPGHDRGH
ncbi:hypothetical protein KC338_g3047 [Hortaea werneckii]|nr:hypothetical protein KC323_g3324 [Hortaea werneckii]KAI6870435.1 hypothetical protein KC338_g3047 [Hortaea werneckii]KAI7353408.1 hypothetical protein KC320_g3972 [Hortaea werneckii]